MLHFHQLYSDSEKGKAGTSGRNGKEALALQIFGQVAFLGVGQALKLVFVTTVAEPGFIRGDPDGLRAEPVPMHIHDLLLTTENAPRQPLATVLATLEELAAFQFSTRPLVTPAALAEKHPHCINRPSLS